MPPIIPRKRLQSESPPPQEEKPAKRAARRPPSRRVHKESVFQTLDTPPTLSRSASKTRALLEQEDDSESSGEASSDEEFEDVDIGWATSSKGRGKQEGKDADCSADEQWEDALITPRLEDEPAPQISGDINVTVSAQGAQAGFSAAPAGKKGPSKIQRQIRMETHCMHVQLLMFHNHLRNAWVQDKEVQKMLVHDLSASCWKEVERYWRDAGITGGPQRVVEGAWPGKWAKQPVMSNWQDTGKWAKQPVMSNWQDTGKRGVEQYVPAKDDKTAKSKAGRASVSQNKNEDRGQWDWAPGSEKLEPNTPNLSAGDPLFRLLRSLTAYWKSKFKITAPSLRKRGYLSPGTCEAEIAAWREDPSDADTFGERIENRESFRQLAEKYQGSRDVGQQLFTALLRGLGIEARMVASLQPLGFAWNQAEEGKGKNLEKLQTKSTFASSRKRSTNATKPVTANRSPETRRGTRISPINLSDDDSSSLSSLVSLSSDSDMGTSLAKPASKSRKYGEELPYPTYWTEAISPLTNTPISVSPLPRILISSSSASEGLSDFYCRGAAAEKAKQVFAYIVAFSSDGSAKDVTTRYLPKQQWPGKTKGVRLPAEKVPIYNKRGKVVRMHEYDWFKDVLRLYARPRSKRQPWDEIEEEGDLVPRKPEKPKTMDEDGGKETLQGYKGSAVYVLERHLRREEALRPGAKVVRYFVTGKGDKEKREPVYYRKDIVTCKTVESWHKEGRAVKEGEQPLKYVPMRAVTVTRKREIEEREREEGKKVKQGLYSRDQTDWIIPEPIQDGKIPRNAFGNIDVYVPTMIPKGAVHIPLKGTAAICRKLGVDYAEACTGFEFGKQRAVPVLTGVVVAAENEDLVIDAWEADQAQKQQKEDDKRTAQALSLWKKFASGLRIIDRMRREYGEEIQLPGPKEKASTSGTVGTKRSEWDAFQNHTGGFEGGFLREDDEAQQGQSAGGFLRDDDDASMADDRSVRQGSATNKDSALTIDDGEWKAAPISHKPPASSLRAPISLHAAHEDTPEVSIDGSVDHIRNREDSRDTPIEPASKRTTRARPRTSKATSKPMDGTEADTGPDRQDRSLQNETSDADVDDSSAAGGGIQRATPLLGSHRTRSKRQSARKADARVRSHFFAEGSDEETDLSPSKRQQGRARRTRAAE
ncbi:Rad4-domain-containing protein [Westerdykella ornata]|uniref:Rad4-domain-containing protein n=1 Tax=Westerdykella ornata TaxID=318751 RepID=A0A6A6JR40_WESOR|nr:Rad4-domain-containing protein [Westerdykella ornata]KAF2278714.1 Rad4-domain-containing protein [Westerdykella ornata]